LQSLFAPHSSFTAGAEPIQPGVLLQTIERHPGHRSAPLPANLPEPALPELKV
jgi:hypothetical protein